MSPDTAVNKTSDSLAQLFEPIRDELVRVEEEFDRQVQSHVRLIPEIGLDYHYDLSPREVQRELFRAQVRLARDLGLPLVVHTREAEADTITILEQEGGGEVRGVFHCFSGSAELASAALGLGFAVSFAGILTFPSAGDLRKVAAAIPADRLLIETDCPYLAPAPHRGRRNEPAWVVRVLEKLAEVRGERIEELARAVDLNFTRVFGG